VSHYNNCLDLDLILCKGEWQTFSLESAMLCLIFRSLSGVFALSNYLRLWDGMPNSLIIKWQALNSSFFCTGSLSYSIRMFKFSKNLVDADLSLVEQPMLVKSWPTNMTGSQMRIRPPGWATLPCSFIVLVSMAAFLDDSTFSL